MGMTYVRTRPAMNCCPSPPGPRWAAWDSLGAVAQLGERFHGMEEVRSSSLRSSTPVSLGAMAQSGSVLPSHGRGGSSILPSSTEPPGPSRRAVSMSGSLRSRLVAAPASAVRSETDDMLGRRIPEMDERQDRYLREPPCGTSTTAGVPAFQAGNAGSTPACRSKRCKH